ncbi:MAG: beta-fructofuranosidase [Frankiales bacterium]|jgi:beta-fructofuranosidase|nr:beta-fructofuranosidase [Frankiales bacterium]
MFYQAIPGRVTWAPNCHWGHAESVDLVHWTERPIALTPQDFEVGCWSGSFVMDAEAPTILYTRIVGDDWGQGRVAIARGDATATDWATGADDVVIDGPPAELGVHEFRDPYVFRSDSHWTMIVAAGLNDGSGAALQYHSTDLITWTYDGVLCSRPSSREDDVWTGALWECPQLFPLGPRWVLIISVWDADVLYYVAAAVGDYDGLTFVHHTWQRLTYGNSAYAMSSFTDKDGQRSVLSWLREEPQNNPDLHGRAGAHSLPAALQLTDDGVLSLSPHANFESVLGEPVAGQPTPNGTVYDIGPTGADIQLNTDGVRQLVITDGPTVRALILLDATHQMLTLKRRGFATETMPLPAPGTASTLEIVLDADLLEMFTTASYGAFRLEPAVEPAGAAVTVLGRDGLQAAVRTLP